MKSKWKEVLCIFVVRLILVKCDYFSIVGSAILRVDEPYRVAVTSHDDLNELLEVKVGIIGITNLGEKIEAFQEVKVGPGKTQLLKFRFRDLSLGTYQLTAQSYNFTKTVGLYVNPQRVTVMIQLDKPIYKTSDTVKFRIFAINSRTKPYKTIKYNKIWILDPKNNELKKWENVEFKMGIFEEKFDFTRLRPGMYEILSEVDGTISSKTFEIFKDTQHIYELKLLVPEKVSFRDGVLKVKISIDLASKYALENLHNIAGKMTLTCDQQKIIKFQKIFNTTHYEITENIDFISDLGLDSLDDRKTFNLKAVFTDDVTKKNYTVKSTFTIEMSDYSIQIVHSPKIFKIGIPYGFTLLVTKAIDGNPVLNSMEPIYVVVRGDKNETLVDDEFNLDPITGSVEVHTPEIPEDTLFLNIYAKYDKIQYFQQVNVSATQRSESISIDVLTARPKMYEQVDFELMTTSKSASFAVFQVFAKGLLKMSQTIPFISGYANFSIIPKFAYTPKAHCIAFFITEDGEMISDTIVLDFDNRFPNFIHLDVNSTDLLTPGTNFTLNVTSTLYSSVSLLAIDQRGISQRYKHDILKDYVFDNELMKYDRAAIENFYDFDIPFWFYPLSYQKTFFEIGAVILTNAIQDIPCLPDKTKLSVYDKINIDSDKISASNKVKVDDGKRYVDGFLFKTIFIDTPLDADGIKGAEFMIAELPKESASWALTAISVHKKYGIVVTADPFVIESYKRFFVDYSVPAFVRKGEIFLVEILVGNLYDMEITGTVKVSNSEYLGYSLSRPWSYGWQVTENGVTQNVVVPPYNVHRLMIEFSAESYGNYDIQIAAIWSNKIDSKISSINIIPAGIQAYKTDTSFIASEDCYSNILRTLKCNLSEENPVSDTLTVAAAVYGDMMGLTLSNLDALIKERAGSANEILYTFVLNVLTLDYLVLTDQLSAAIKTKAVYYLKQTYQKLIKYRNIDGSFSSFIAPNMDGSVWLTANVLRYLRKAQRYIDINEDVFLEALVFIASNQIPCGAFTADANGTQTDVAFTAFIGMIFDENVKSYPQYITVVQKAVEYVELHNDKANLYSLALVTYFMYEVDSPLKYELLQSLLSHIQYVASSNLTKDFNVTSVDVEINSYCLMILDHIPELYVEAFSIVQWLLVQQKPNGKFISIRDTIVALEAISRFAARFSGVKENLELELSRNGDDENVEYSSISSQTKLIKQIYEFPPTTNYLDVSAHGNGFAIIQLSCTYYVNSVQANDAIKLSTQFKEASCSDYLILTISLELSLANISDVIVISIESPSGFVYDTVDSWLPKYVMNIEELNKGTLLHIYLKNFPNTTAFDVAFLRKFMIFNPSMSSIEVYDFNNETTKTTTFYGAPQDLSPCSYQTLSTSPPIFDFTTLEPLATEFHKIRETTDGNEIEDEITETPEETTEADVVTESDESVDGRNEELDEDALTTEFYVTAETEESETTEVDESEAETTEVEESEAETTEAEESEAETTEAEESEAETTEAEESETEESPSNESSDQEVDSNVEEVPINEDILDPENTETTESDEENSTDSEADADETEELSDIESSTSKIFPDSEDFDSKSDDSENSSITEENPIEEVTTTTIQPEEISTKLSKEKFKKKLRPNALPQLFKNIPRPKPKIPKMSKFPSKIKFTRRRT